MIRWLHIGLQKTGTTTLQHDFFPRLRGIVYLGGKGTRLGAAVEADMRRLVVGLKSSGDRPEMVASLARLLAARSAMSNPLGPAELVSEEGFSESLPRSPFDRIAVLPTALRTILGEATRVVLVVRDPFAFLASLYEQRMATLDLPYLREIYRCTDGPCAIDDYLRIEQDRRQSGAFDTIFDAALRFDRVVGAYATAFGDDQVHVLPFEPMVERPDDFCRAWCRLLGVPDQVIALPRRNASGPERRRAILARFGIGPADARAAAFEGQFADLPARLAADPLLAGYAARHCEPVRARAAATFAALTAAAPSSTPGGERGETA
ncbi:MAG: hypothetical protein AB7O45_15395 [Alphaproteobacteria bacterium]